MARLQGVYKLPNGSIPKGGTIKLRVPRDRNTTGGSPYTMPAKFITIVGTQPGVPTEDDPDPAPVEVCRVGFAGP